MGKYDSFSRQSKIEKPQGPHPIWRGIGFMFMILIPLLSFLIADVLIQENLLQEWFNFSIPADLYAKPGELLYPAGRFIYAKLIITATLSFILFALFTFFTFAMNSMFGASRYGPYDMPPVSKPRGTKIRKAR